MRLVRWLAWLLVVVAQPAWAQVSPYPQPAATQPSPHLQFLQRRIATIATENPGEYGIAALDLATGETISFNGHRAFPMASTMKIAVAAVYLAEVDAGRRSLNDTIAGVSARRLMDSMIVRSNNHATDLLMASLGGPATIDRWLRWHGLSGMRVDRNIAQLLRARRDLRDIRDSSTPMAMLNLLRLIDSGGALRPASRALLMDMMRRCETGTNRIPALLPRSARVEHKTGTLNGYASDVGFLTLPGGRRIAVALFARYGSNRPAVIASAARAIYDAFIADSQMRWARNAAPWTRGGAVQARATWPHAQPPSASAFAPLRPSTPPVASIATSPVVAPSTPAVAPAATVSAAAPSASPATSLRQRLQPLPPPEAPATAVDTPSE